MTGPLPTDERLLDLLAAHATQGLSVVEDLEMRRLLLNHPGVASNSLETAAAAVDLAIDAGHRSPGEDLPPGLRERILLSAEDHLSRPRRASRAGVAGWIVAAAAVLIALAMGWMGRVPSAPGAARRQTLLATADVVIAQWRSEIERYAAVEGDVVWSDRLQAGFLRFRGLPANESGVDQYQLWIVDPSRDIEPVDGGVFDVPGGVIEVVVPIDAKLSVNHPVAFAVTLEKHGGVVVSEGPLLLVASVES